jgi:hypothetical protein
MKTGTSTILPQDGLPFPLKTPYKNFHFLYDDIFIRKEYVNNLKIGNISNEIRNP